MFLEKKVKMFFTASNFYSKCLSTNCAVIKFSLSGWNMVRKMIYQIYNIYNLYVTIGTSFHLKIKQCSIANFI